MENNPFTNTQAESSDMDVEKPKKKKKTTKIPRRMPLGVSVQAEKDVGVTKEGKPKPVLSISEHLMQQMEERAQKAKEAEELNKKEQDETENVPLGEEASAKLQEAESDQNAPGSVKQEAEPVTPNDTVKIIKTEEQQKQPDASVVDRTEETQEVVETVASPEDMPESVLDAADWEPEGEPVEGGKVNLSSNQQNESVETDNLSEEEFAEIPAVRAETDIVPDAETTEHVEPELLETGLEAEEASESGDEVPAEDLPVDASTAYPGRSIVPAELVWYDAAAADRAKTEQERALNDAEYRGEKRGNRHGVAAGLFAGWLFGRRGKKKAEKEHQKELKIRDKEIRQLKDEQLAAATRLEAVKSTQEHLQSNIRQEGLKRAAGPENEPTAPVGVTTPREKLASGSPEAVPAHIEAKADEKIGEKVKEAIVIAAAKAIRPPERPIFTAAPEKQSRNYELAFTHEDKRHEELPPEEQELTEETYQTQSGRRVETSAWHRIEIDEKTGKPVDNPEVAYGEEFKRERQREVLREDRMGGTASGPAGVLGGLATSSATVSEASVQAQEADRESGLYENSSDASLAVPRPDAEHQHLTAGSDLLRYANSPLVWVVAVIIVVVLFVLGVLR